MKDRLLLTVPIRPVDAVAFWRSGMVPLEVHAAVARTLERVGPLERWAVEREWREGIEAKEPRT